jgi:hypothetical protein
LASTGEQPFSRAERLDLLKRSIQELVELKEREPSLWTAELQLELERRIKRLVDFDS